MTFEIEEPELHVDPERLAEFSTFLDLAPHEGQPLGTSAPSANVENMNTVAPMPYLRKGKPADAFRKLRTATILGAGFDFLEKVSDMMRSKNFQSNKPGVANKSRHKCGQAFDYNQENSRLIVVSEPKNGKQYFRTYLKCAKQDGTLGTKTALKDIRGHKVNVWSWDFTAAAEEFGFKRIPAWSGWQSSYTKKEFWHYELTEGTTYEEAIEFLYPKTPVKILKRGDKGFEVITLQTQLVELGYLKPQDIDSNFGPKTEHAVKRLQLANGLTADGMVGPQTVKTINRLIEEKKKMGNDFDYNTDDVNARSEEGVVDDLLDPKPWYRTSAFYTLLTTYIVGGLVAFLVSSGVVAEGQSQALTDIIAGAIVFGIAYVSGKFIEGRSAVSVAKAQGATALRMARMSR